MNRVILLHNVHHRGQVFNAGVEHIINDEITNELDSMPGLILKRENVEPEVEPGVEPGVDMAPHAEPCVSNDEQENNSKKGKK